MSLVGSNSAAYTSSVGSSGDPSAASSLFYYRHPALHHPYHDPPQSYYLASSSWSESPGSSGRSVSPCDEYQPPLGAADYSIPSSLHDLNQQHQPVQTFVRVTKRRTTANKKERRRTQSINNAFADLRDCIPNVPSDTKLSKIKTLRLATSYIAYLMGVLADEDAATSGGGFRADLLPKRTSSVAACNARHSSGHSGHLGHPGHVDEQAVAAAEHARRCSELAAAVAAERKSKGRTGWPQHVWALELKP